MISYSDDHVIQNFQDFVRIYCYNIDAFQWRLIGLYEEFFFTIFFTMGDEDHIDDVVRACAEITRKHFQGVDFGEGHKNHALHTQREEITKKLFEVQRKNAELKAKFKQLQARSGNPFKQTQALDSSTNTVGELAGRLFSGTHSYRMTGTARNAEGGLYNGFRRSSEGRR